VDGSDYQGTGTINVSIAPAQGPSIQISANGGTVTFSAFGLPGEWYTLERSLNGTDNWTPLENVQASSTDGSITATDTPGTSSAYYRLVWPKELP
jgi:hypothetical protein